MKTVSDRIVEIKKALDELENQVNTTLSIMDCKSLPLEKHSAKYKDFKWQRYDSFSYKWTSVFETKELVMENLETFRHEFKEIHDKNLLIIGENKKTFEKICLFFEKLGLSSKTHAASGKGRNYRSYQVDSQWVEMLKNQYPMVDLEYTLFETWFKNQTEEVERYFKNADLEKAKKAEEEYLKSMKNKATSFLLANGKKIGEDFDIDNSIAVAKTFRADQLMAEMRGKEVDISCCDDCSTWIAGEHRCSCGNRRMSWSLDSHDEDYEKVNIYPEAY